MNIFIIFFLPAVFFLGNVGANTFQSLVLLDSKSIESTHSIFLRSLSEIGGNVTVLMADDKRLALMKHGKLIYDNLFILAPTVEEFGGDLDVDAIVNYHDQGGNVFLTASPKLTPLIRELGGQFGVEYDEATSSVIDHFHVEAGKDSGSHSVFRTKQLIDVDVLAGKRRDKAILYSGLGMSIDESSISLMGILRGESTSYSYFPNKPIVVMPHVIGREAVLVAGVQSRNNARAIFTGSLEMLSDDYFNFQGSAGKVGNQEFSQALVRWVSQKAGVLRVLEAHHHREGETTAPATYTIRDKMQFGIEIQELVEGGKWSHFHANDVQFEFVRVDPFVRLNMKNDKKNKEFSVLFELPDVYGVFKCKVEYFRQGYSFISSITQVPVRPFTHNQYERFIPCAFPYYAGAFSMMGGFLLFSFVFLHYSDPNDVSPKKNQ